MSTPKKPPATVAEPVALYEAKTNLSALVDRAAAGDSFVITKSGKPMARLVPLAPEPVVRQRALGRGQWQVADDFDAPLPTDVLDSFDGA